ncbi:hypothetical protein [Alteraurantiacibacter buctensis]|uniref:DUF4214 domain-containing protein n=1 Tax=Alteraurantiacibacter buctensis TaxID=1503981 RepID=A0A844YSP1_9SPHN|nr:hypothetical protein [Alteraurantiacibacter buctensis]MXO70100.1 hypothetical protein [Alteraurantiacibacter buctensis]
MTTKTTIRTAALLLSASAIALSAMPAQANEVLFSNTGRTRVEPGERIATGGGVLQVRLDSGATVSFVEEADFRLSPDGTIELYSGSVTVAGAGSATTVVRMPQGVEGRVTGAGNAAVFTADEEGESNGHVLTGEISLTRGTGAARVFEAGEMWASAGNGAFRQVIAREATAAPPADAEEPQVFAMREGGPVAAAQNGLPVSLGDALAAAGASSDIIGAARRVEAAGANPSLDTYPTGDLALLVARAVDLAGANGGSPFPQAQADIIRAYLGYLAGGGGGQTFLTAYAGFLTQYLGLIRAGGVPSQFSAASQADINAFLAFQSGRGALGQLSAQDRTLAEAYLAFIRGGGNANLFTATYTDLIEAYFAFVRGGGDPAAFAGASTQTIDAYVAFLAESGLVTQLAPADQELLAAYRANGSFAFAATYAAALQSYFGYLAAGNLPSTSTSLTPAQLRSYLELLSASGQLDRLLGDQAQFYAAYLDYLRQGGAVDGFALLNANVFAGYAGQLGTFYAYLQAGGLPSAYTGDVAALRSYLEVLANAGALEPFLGANAGFFADYLAYLNGGGAIDGFAGLNANIFAGYAQALNAYYAFLAGGGLPSGYTALTQEQIAAYVAALRAQGATSAFLAGLADFYTDYAAFLAGGGNPDLFTGLPTLNLPAFADALNAYAAYLAGGGLPGGYGALDQSVLAIYLDALERSGQLSALLGGNAGLLSAYFAYLETGGAPDRFSGLPLYQGYVSALQAYFTFLDNGGLPGDYTALTPQQVRDYLAALSNAGGFTLQLGNLADFYTAYFAYLGTGGAPNGFSGLPLYADYVSALNAYYAFLAGGGLPQNYTALTAQQIQSYLAALNAAGGFAAYSGLNAFFAQYYAFVAGGGNPANFGGLPVYADYLAALELYYAFLLNGGLPSAYTALTAEQARAYIEALNGAGILSAQLTADELDFVLDYLAFLQGGGNPDQFAGLPANSGGGTGGNPGTITPPVTLAYAGGFNPSVARINFVTSLSGTSPGSESGFDATAFALNASGGLTSYTRTGGTTRTSGSTTISDISGNADVLIGRWHSGTNTGANPFTLNANQGFHYMLARPVADTFALPAQGRIDYELLAATRPTIVDGSVAPGGITADMAILLGASPKLAFDATLTMPGANGGANQTFRYATTGGLANAAQSTTDFALFPNKSFQLRVDGVSGTNCTDVNTCYFQAFGQFGGDEDTIGLTYVARNDQGSAKALIGAAIFGNGTLTGGAAATTLRSNQALAYANKLIGTDSYANVQVRYDDATGAPVGFIVSADEQMALGTASVTQSGNAGTTLYWSRWNSGTPTGTYYGDAPGAIGANGSYHMISGTPATTRPASGTVNYELVGSTAPTFQDERTTAGTLTGSAAVAFGATPRLGLNLDVAIGGQSYNVATAGGVATPSSSGITIAANNTFDSPFNSLTVTTTSSFCTPNCSAFVDGFLAGDNASHMGLAYAIRNNSNPQTFIDGTAAFAAVAGGGGTPAPTQVTTGLFTSEARLNSSNDLGQHPFNLEALTPVTDGSTGYELNASGEIVGFFRTGGFGGSDRIGTASQADSGGITGGSLAWTRWTNGVVDATRNAGSSTDISLSANQGYHAITGTPATNLPTTGRVDYDLVGGTRPTHEYGTAAPGTLVSGGAAVLFGTTTKVGIELEVTYNSNTYIGKTTGGLTDLATSELTLTNGSFNAIGAFGNVTGGTCGTGCRPIWTGFLSGDGGEDLALQYIFQLGNSNNELIGVAGFTRSAGGGTPAIITGAQTNQHSVTANYAQFQDIYSRPTNYDANGIIDSYTISNGSPWGRTANMAPAAEAGSVAGAMGWARWTSGSTQNGNLTANQGTHIISGTPATNLPASGVVRYEMIGATKPTDGEGALAPGEFSGTIGVDFATRKVGIDFNVTMGVYGWNLRTSGGFADPSAGGLSLFSENQIKSQVTVTGVNAASCTNNCSASVDGFLYGSGASHFGVAYALTDRPAGMNQLYISGAAAFAAGSGNAGSAPATTLGLAATPEWDRWGAEAAGDTAPQVATAPGIEQAGPMGVTYSPEQLAQLEAWVAAQRVN